jgi:hypothetical protein
MKLEDFQEYFDLFITNYLPFKDKEIYQTISNYLLDYYFVHSYSDIPDAFKQAYEEQVIPVEFYDSILMSNGFPDYIVSKLSLNDKYILLQSFMDFNRYKGTLESIRKVSASFDDTFNVYELYLDYKITNPNDPETVEKKWDWVFVPDLVYKNPELEDSLTGNVFKYSDITDKTKYYLVSKETVEELRKTENILLPIKTNLIVMDYKGLYKHSTLLTLYSSIILNYFKDFTIILYLKDGQYKTSFKNFYKAWYYIFLKAFDIKFSALDGSYIIYNFDDVIFPFDLTQLHIIKSEYEKISTKTELVAFQEKYIDVFKTYSVKNEQTSEDLVTSYRLDLPPSLLEYLDTRLKISSDSEDVISELYNSLITWMYSLQSIHDEYREFLNIFIKQLPLLQVSIQDTTSYLLINHFKPYHVEIVLNEANNSLYVKDKFESLFIDNPYLLKTLITLKSLEHASHKILSFLNYYDTSNLTPNEFTDLNILLTKNLKFLSQFLITNNIKYNPNTLENISHNTSLNTNLLKNFSEIYIESMRMFNILQLVELNINTQHDLSFNIRILENSIVTLSNYVNYTLKSASLDESFSISHDFKCY